VVVVPDAGVVFTGDMFWNHNVPNLIDADTTAQIASNATFVRDYPADTFVPGHGEIGHAADVRAFHDYLLTLQKSITTAKGKGEQGDVLGQDVLAQLKPTYGGWDYFDYFATKNIAQTVAELADAKRRPVPAP
jgi:glyoxylase-like metal-dependent hydrolase (beta-lactamase superfamily II)